MRVILYQSGLGPKVLTGEKTTTLRSFTGLSKKGRIGGGAKCEPGDTLSHREWTGKAYRSKQRLLCEDHPQLTLPRRAMLEALEAHPGTVFMLLTKRPENVLQMVPYHWMDNWPNNVWLGTTVEDQQRADERIPLLLSIPANVRFLSCEPLLGKIDLMPWLYGDCDSCGEPYYEWQRWLDPVTKDVADQPTGLSECGYCGQEFEDVEFRHFYNQTLHWIITGGESGTGHRALDMSAVNSLAAQCDSARVSLFVKQDSGPQPGKQGRLSDALFNRKEFPKL